MLKDRDLEEQVSEESSLLDEELHEPIIILKDVVKEYSTGSKALQGIYLRINKGERSE